MTTTAAQLHSLMPEMAATIGGRVRKVWCRDPHTFVLEVRQGGQNHFLRLSGIEGAAGACMVEGKPTRPPEPPSFIMLLRKVLAGARLLSIAQLQEDRLLRLDVLRRHHPEGHDAPIEARHTLIAELTARHPNLFLLDEEGLIMGNMRDTQHSQRDLGHAQPYTPPQPPPPEVRRRAWTDPLDLESLPADGARSRRLAAHLDATATVDTARALASDLLKRLRQQRKSLARRLTAIEADLQRAEGATLWRRWGELLQSAYGQTIARGSEVAHVPDFYAEGMPLVEVPLDPTEALQTLIRTLEKRRVLPLP